MQVRESGIVCRRLDRAVSKYGRRCPMERCVQLLLLRLFCDETLVDIWDHTLRKRKKEALNS